MKKLWILAAFLAVTLSYAQTTPTTSFIDPRAYGAVGNGVTDDTAALQAALNAGGTVQLPPLTFRVTSPLYLLTSNTHYPSIVGASGSLSIILADYTRWPTNESAVIEINSSAAGTGNASQPHGRLFSNFQIQTENVGSSTTPIGIRVASVNPANPSALQILTSAQAEAANYLPTYNAHFEKIHFVGLTTAIEVDESWNITLNDLHGVYNVNGIVIKGFAVGVHIQNCNFGVPSSSTGTGVLIDGHTYSNSVFMAPQDVTVDGSAFVGFANAANMNSGLQIRVQNSILDEAGSSAVHIGWAANGVYLGPNNWIWTNSASASAVAVDNSSNSGLWITRNNIGANAGSSGIIFAPGSSTRTGVTIEGNIIQGFTNPIYLNSPPQYSAIRDNHGYNNRGAFISLGGSGSAAGLFIDGNASKDSQPIFSAGSITGYSLGFNASASQTLGATLPSLTLSGTLTVGNGTNIVYRCLTPPYQVYWGSTAPAGCGTPVDTGLRVQ